MCLAIPGQIVEISGGDVAKVDFSGVRRNVNIALVRDEGATVGAWVLVHVGFVLRILDEEQAVATLQYLKELGGEYREEPDEIRRSKDADAANAAASPPQEAR